MAWTQIPTIYEETFAGPSVEQFVEFEGVFQRLLNLNQIGAWSTMWIVFLLSVRAYRKDMYAPTVGTDRDCPYWENLSIGIRSSASTHPFYASNDNRTYHYPEGRQWCGVGGSLSGSPAHALDTNGDNWLQLTQWRMLYREDGTLVNYSGGWASYNCLEVGPSIRRPYAIVIKKDTTTHVGQSVPYNAIPMADVTKQACKDWLLNNSTSVDFTFNRPAGNTYGPPVSSGIDISEGTYGALDTVVLSCNKPGIFWRLHGIWGRVFSTLV